VIKKFQLKLCGSLIFLSLGKTGTRTDMIIGSMIDYLLNSTSHMSSESMTTD